MRLPKVVQDLISSFEKLPGVGHRTAQRLTFYLLRVPQRDLDLFSTSLASLKKKTHLCSLCHNLSEHELCLICSDASRNKSQVCVVEGFQDVIAIEHAGSYEGVYHVLHGSLSPLNNVGPEELFVSDLIDRLERGDISEVILATNTSLEGEATALYIADRIEKLRESTKRLKNLKVTRIGRGLPTGVELEYADDETLVNALSSRRLV